jgi:hypothetical protein
MEDHNMKGRVMTLLVKYEAHTHTHTHTHTS